MPNGSVHLADPESSRDRDAVVRLDNRDDAATADLRLAQRRFHLLLVDGEPCGIARLDWVWELIPYLGYIGIEPAHRGFGYSRLLLDAVVEHARASGQPRLFSSSTADEPEPQAWHRHVGFRDAGRIRELNDFGEDEVFFCLDL